MGAQLITVNVTPDGRGDAVVCGRFVKPEERRMTFAQFAAALREREGGLQGSRGTLKELLLKKGVHYLSLQDDNLRTEHPQLASDVPSSVTWFEEALGCAPDAVNLWVGDERAMSAVHADHYENLYCVISGEKVFTLLPPADAISRDLAPRPVGRFAQRTDGAWEVCDEEAPSGGVVGADGDTAGLGGGLGGGDGGGLAGGLGGGDGGELGGSFVEWIGIDPAEPEQLPALSGAVTVRVGAGEMLYLPANWFHRVTQSAQTVAVNYWHDPLQSAVPPGQILAQFARKVHRALHGHGSRDRQADAGTADSKLIS